MKFYKDRAIAQRKQLLDEQHIYDMFVIDYKYYWIFKRLWFYKKYIKHIKLSKQINRDINNIIRPFTWTKPIAKFKWEDEICDICKSTVCCAELHK